MKSIEVTTLERPEDLLEVAFEAARAGATHLLEGYGRVYDVKLKGTLELVAEYFAGTEGIIRKTINRHFPGHSILAEGGGLQEAKSPYRWYFDPLDGTTNFSRGHPFFAVSVACCLMIPGRSPKPLAAVTYAPVLRETFWASDGGGAKASQDIQGRGLIEDKIKASTGTNPLEALVCVGFPFEAEKRDEKVLKPINKTLPKVRDLRRAGAPTLDMAYVAAGRADGYFEYGPMPWDLAAGSLLVTEAGGVVTDMAGKPFVLERSESVCAASAKFHPVLMSLLK
ncbi:MAG: inositol monophosphatase [Deltaproteobacteria bacterium]|jgi:myo-inositol-1(or 4)-monophosphatase|nr:inositol monophosphatase [Deltaproteobacteria bacterium]